MCLPGFGPLVTNCGIDRARARGLSRYGAGGNEAWLHVSAGIGTSPYAPDPLRLPPGSDPADLDAPHARLPRGHGVWRSLVARFVRDEEAAGSNPVTPTM